MSHATEDTGTPAPTLSRRRVLALAAGGALLGPGLAQRAAAQGMTGLTFGYTLAADYLPFFVAQEKGFFAARNLAVNFQLLSNGGPIPAALQGGSLQIGISTATALIQAAGAGLELVAVMGATRQTKADKIAALVCRTGLNVSNAADLRGKVVGAPGVNNILAVLLQKWLLDNQVPASEVRLVETSFAQMPDLLRAGTLDAGLVVEPFLSRIVAQGAATQVHDYLGGYDDLVFGIIMSTRAWADANKPAIAAWREAASQGLAWLRANPEEAHAIALKWLKIDTPKFPPFDLAISPADLAAYVPTLTQLQMIHGQPDLARLIAA